MGRDLWMKQFIDRHFSTPEQRGRAAALFLKLEFLVYLMIILGVLVFILRAFF
ncbi:MAG: hypothetical protein KAU14_05295 [Thermoplasmata archaeon]|nr:hypothetical protein [Thermoplasmata archaeon]